MPDIGQDYPHLNDFTQDQLYQRRTELIGAAPSGDFKQLTDAVLMELVVIARVLRKRTSAPRSSSSGSRSKITPTLDAL